MEKSVWVAMSGGVDSSVAALLVKEQGHRCAGVTLSLAGGEDAADAQAVARALGMPFAVLDFSAEFRRDVIERFAAAYQRGETPNPCVDCNRFVKLGKLLEEGAKAGYPYVATGHYARVEFDGPSGRWLLKKGLDEGKDQSYMLYTLGQEQLSRLVLPLGALSKEEVRRLAEERGFGNARKRDSQDICFVPDGDYAGFIRRFTGRDFPPGDFVGTGGQVYGRHRGIIHYTVGQRKGLGLSFPQPMFVKEIDTGKNQVVLAPAPELFTREVWVRDVNLIAHDSLDGPLRGKARVRYRQKEQPATAWQTGPHTLRVVFDEPQRAVTPGQALVLYRGDVVIGGGTIVRQ